MVSKLSLKSTKIWIFFFPFGEVKICGETCEEKSVVMVFYTQVLFYTQILKSFQTAAQDFNKFKIVFFQIDSKQVP